jgi:predicted RNase H-like HicB family nuclease
MTKVGKTLVFTSWVMVEPAEDIPGVWVGHCLDFDVISQGDSLQNAIDSVTEAVAMTVIDDVQNGLDPGERRAPSEFWERLAQILKHGERVKISDLSGNRKVVVATELTLILERIRPDSAGDFSQFNVPPVTAHIDQVCAA